MKKIAVLALVGALTVSGTAYAYRAQKGDSYWKLSRTYNVPFSELLRINGKTESSELNIGDSVLIPGIDVHIAKEGDTFWKISVLYGIPFSTLLSLNGANQSSWLDVGQTVYLTDKGEKPQDAWISYSSYITVRGDTLWALAQKFGLPYQELCEANNMGDGTVLYPGMKITVPVHHVPETKRASEKHGEYLDWWTQAQYVVPVGAELTVRDFYTGREFHAKRTTGANHADCEPLTSEDTAEMKAIWGGAFTWDARPVIVIADGRYIAASAASFEHGGNENAAGGVWTSWRSGDYGAGYNYDWVKGNGYSGHFDIHFLNSTTHNTGKVNDAHRKNIEIAAGK